MSASFLLFVQSFDYVPSGSSFVLKGGVPDERQEEEEAPHFAHHDILKNRIPLFEQFGFQPLATFGEVLARAKRAKPFS
jgi:hypothetical protein